VILTILKPAEKVKKTLSGMVKSEMIIPSAILAFPLLIILIL